MEQEKMSELYGEEMNIPTKGSVFKGSVVRVHKNDVFVDFGFKYEGVVPIEDFYTKERELAVEVGDEVEIVLEDWSQEEGLPILSKRKADLKRESERLDEDLRTGGVVKARIVGRVKGGLIADVGREVEIRAFIPSSQIDIRPPKDIERLVGETIEAKVISKSASGYVLSRRVLLEEQRQVERQKTLASLEEGKSVRGRVVKIIDQGVFVDIGGVEGFVPLSELAWGRVRHPSEVVSQDAEIDAVVIKIEGEDRITLSRRLFLPDPWLTAGERYSTGDIVEGKVVSTTDFGVFVELEPGVEGLVHSSELTWTKKFRHPKEVVSTGTRVQAVVLGIDAEKRRISLSLRRIEQSPWEAFREQNPPGTVVRGVVENVTPKGVFVKVAEGLVGLVRPGDISWKGWVEPQDHFSVGDEVDVVVLGVDPKGERISLGVKQLKEDPWKRALETLKPNSSVVTGRIVEVKENGVLVELPGEVFGFIKSQDFALDGQDPSKTAKVGDEVTAKVKGFDRERRQVSLSRSQYEAEEERKKVSNFISSQGDVSVTLGDVFGERLKELIKN
jgi:small subunit ribosomal protein S1